MLPSSDSSAAPAAPPRPPRGSLGSAEEEPAGDGDICRDGVGEEGFDGGSPKLSGVEGCEGLLLAGSPAAPCGNEGLGGRLCSTEGGAGSEKAAGGGDGPAAEESPREPLLERGPRELPDRAGTGMAAIASHLDSRAAAWACDSEYDGGASRLSSASTERLTRESRPRSAASCNAARSKCPPPPAPASQSPAIGDHSWSPPPRRPRAAGPSLTRQPGPSIGNAPWAAGDGRSRAGAIAA